MDYKLLVSHDAGCSYRCSGQSENLDDLAAKGKKYDDEGLRWAIEDETGKLVEASLIHKQIISFMVAVRQREK